MRITTRLRIISIATAISLAVLASILFWSFIEFKSAKNNYFLADAIKINFFERASFRDQYFLYREDRAHAQWDQSKKTADHLLSQANLQFYDEENRKILEHLHKDLEDIETIFHRIVKNTELLRTITSNHEVYEELDRRLFSQLLLKAASVRNEATALKDASAQRVELTYKHLSIIIGLFAITLAFITILTSMHLSRLIRRRLGLLHDGAKNVADGDLSYRLNAEGTDEFSELAQSINSMTDRLNQEIHMRREREEELAKAQAMVKLGSWHVIFGEDATRDVWTISKELRKLYGHADDKEIDFNTGLAVMPPEDQELTQRYWAEAKRGVGPTQWDHRIIVNDEIHWVHISARFVFDAHGNPLEASGTGQDITERKLAEMRLAESESRFHEIFDTVNDAIFIHDAETGRIIDVNQRMLDMYGLNREQVMACGPDDLSAAVPPYSAADAAEKIHLTLTQGPQIFDWLARNKDGQLFWVEVSLRLAVIGNQQRILAVARDISERKQAEEQMKQSLSLLSATLESTNNAILVVDLNNTWVLYNKQFIELWQITDEIITARDDTAALTYVLSQLHDPDAFLSKVQELYATPESSSFDTVHFRNGKVVERYSIPQRIGEAIVGRVWSFHDVTEQRQAEDTLRKLSIAIEQSPASVVITDLDAHIQYVNPRFTEVTGYSAAEVIGLNPRILQSEQTPLEVYLDMWGKLSSGQPWHGELFNKRKNGDLYWEETHIAPVKNTADNVTHYVAVKIDITVRKMIEERLHNSENRYRSLVESSPMSIHEIDLNGRFVSMNRAGLHMLGLAEENAVISLNYLDTVSDDDRHRIAGWLAKACEGETSYFDFRSVGEDKQILRSCFVPVQGGDGRVVKIMGITEDITKRKRIEDRIKELNRDFVSFLENTSDFIYFKDKDSRFRFCSQTLANITGHENWRNMIGKHDLEVFPPDTARIYYEEELPIFREGKPLLNKIDPYYDTDGNPGWISTSKWPLLDHEGKVTGLFGISRDITASKQAELALQRESEKNLALLRNASDGIHILDTQGNVIEVSDSFCAMLGYTRDEVVGMNVAQWDAQFTDAERSAKIREQFDLKRRSLFETRHRRKDGSIFDVEVSGFPLELGGQPVLFNSSRDITKRKAAEGKLQNSEASLRAILDNVPYLIWLKDISGRFIAVNRAFFNTTGLSRIQDVLGKTDFDLWPEHLAQKYSADDAEVLSMCKQKLTEEMSMDNGEIHWVETFKAPIMDMDGHLLGTTGFAQDITGRKNAEGKIRHLAHYDPLTDLPNRTLFSDRLQQALATAKRDKTHMALMFLDLDKFKPINDTLGHHVGDLLLKEAAKRMQDCVRESDTVARIGGDEFVVLLPVIETEQDAILVAEKVRETLNRAFVLVGQSLNISSSTGIAVYPQHGTNETQLMKNADIAMYHAKESGRDNVKLYQPDLQNDERF